MGKRLIGTLVVLIALGIGVPAVGGVQLGDVDPGGTVDVSAASPPATNGSTPLDTEAERASVLIVFENDTAREAAAFPDRDVTVTGGHGVDFMPVLYASVPTEAIDAIERRSDVQAVYRDSRVSNPDDAVASETTLRSQSDGQVTPWGVDRIDAPEANGVVDDAAKANVTVAILDTGIDYTHADLNGSVSWGANFTDGVDESGLSTAMDDNGHGTAAAGVVAAADDDHGVVGVAPGTELYAMKVLNSEGDGYMRWLISGIESALDGEDGELGTSDDADVLSMSLGGSEGSSALANIIEEASEHAVVVSSAGNDGDGDITTNNVTYPAKYPGAIAVAATNQSDQTTVWSAEGDEIELAAPGHEIRTTWPSGKKVKSGTSFSAPHVSGVAALVIAQDLADGTRDLSKTAVRHRLQNATLDIESSGIDPKSGYGLILADEAVGIKSVDVTNFSVSDLSPGETAVTAGETIDVNGTVTNVGNAEGTQMISLTHNESIVDETAVTLAAGESTAISFSNVFGNLGPGAYEYGVHTANDSQTATLTVQKPAEFAVSNLEPGNASVTRGDIVNVSATIENRGDVEGIQSIGMRIDGQTVANESLTLGKGANATVSFELATEAFEVGTVSYGVFSDDDGQSASLTIEEPSTLNVEGPEYIVPGTKTPITYTITNTGSESVTNISLSVTSGMNVSIENANRSHNRTLGPDESWVTNATVVVNESFDGEETSIGATATVGAGQTSRSDTFDVVRTVAIVNGPKRVYATPGSTVNVTYTLRNAGITEPEKGILQIRTIPEPLDIVGSSYLALGFGEPVPAPGETVKHTFELSVPESANGTYQISTRGSLGSGIRATMTTEIDTSGRWFDPYVTETGIVDNRGINKAVSEYLRGDLSPKRLNALVSAYLTGSSPG